MSEWNATAESNRAEVCGGKPYTIPIVDDCPVSRNDFYAAKHWIKHGHRQIKQHLYDYYRREYCGPAERKRVETPPFCVSRAVREARASAESMTRFRERYGV